jgi:hypothetical protein
MGGLENALENKRISNLLICCESKSPSIPRDPPIWHCWVLGVVATDGCPCDVDKSHIVDNRCLHREQSTALERGDYFLSARIGAAAIL